VIPGTPIVVNSEVKSLHIAVFLLLLLGFDSAHGPAIHLTTWEKRLVAEDDHVERVSVLGFGCGNEAEVVGKNPFIDLRSTGN
jgi:hypothetical protein